MSMRCEDSRMGSRATRLLSGGDLGLPGFQFSKPFEQPKLGNVEVGSFDGKPFLETLLMNDNVSQQITAAAGGSCPQVCDVIRHRAGNDIKNIHRGSFHLQFQSLILAADQIASVWSQFLSENGQGLPKAVSCLFFATITPQETGEAFSGHRLAG